MKCADKLNIAVVGGGTHPFQQWHERRIYDKPRFRELSELYGYLSKQFTIFGQHVHVGCPDADSALLMLHRMSRYIPHFIALSASSPFVQGQDTQFDSARLNSVFAFPMSGRAPFTLSWDEFGKFFAKTTRTGVVKSMKDFYWDIRPKPEYGTIEIRVFDTPLTVERAAALAGFVQSLASWFLHEQPFMPQEDDYMVYTYNRFQACRFGLDAVYVDPPTGQHMPLRDHILQTLRQIGDHARQRGRQPWRAAARRGRGAGHQRRALAAREAGARAAAGRGGAAGGDEVSRAGVIRIALRATPPARPAGGLYDLVQLLGRHLFLLGPGANTNPATGGTGLIELRCPVLDIAFVSTRKYTTRAW